MKTVKVCIDCGIVPISNICYSALYCIQCDASNDALSLSLVSRFPHFSFILGQGGGQKAKGAAGSSGRSDNKASALSQQSGSDANILDFMAAIEQRAVDIISEYLLTVANNAGTTLGNSNKYPAPGPSTPMRGTGRLQIDMNESNIVDEADSANITDAGNADPDSKPIDLTQFYDKLKKRKNVQTTSMGGTGGNPSSLLNNAGNTGTFGTFEHPDSTEASGGGNAIA